MRSNSTLWRAMAAARRSNLAAAGEAMPVPMGAGIARRALLKGIVAAGAMAALPRPAHALPSGRVAIVGGGIAGLTALHHLRQSGVDAHLYEARARTGGRMFTQRPASGPAFEAGGQLVNTDHHDMQELAKTFGIPLIDRKDEAHRTLILSQGALVSEEALADGLRPIAAQIGTDADWLDKDYEHAAAALDALSIRDYLDRHSRLLQAPWVRSLLEETSRTEYGVEPDRASAIELIFNLPTVDGTRAEVLGGADERFVLEGGSSALTDAITQRYLARITRGKRLLRIERAGAAMQLVFLDGSVAEADTVILAVPAPIARQIDFRVPLPADWRAFIGAMELGRNEKVQASAATHVWRDTMGVGGELWQTGGEGYALGWDGTVHLPGGKADPVWTWFLGGAQIDDPGAADVLARRFAMVSEPAIPGLVPATADGPYRRTGWHFDALTLGAYVNYPPGHLTKFGHLLWIESDDPAERQTPRAGDILFAGEHLSDAFPGYMNGGAQTGRMAVEAILGRKLLSQAA